MQIAGYCSSRVYTEVGKCGWQLVNADLTLVAQTPKMAPHKTAMLANLAADLVCDPGQLNIKATTTEGLGYTGRKEGIACHVVVLLAEREM